VAGFEAGCAAGWVPATAYLGGRKGGVVENSLGYPSEIGRGECAAGSYATHPYPSIIVRPQIQGFTLSRIPEVCALLLTEGGPPMIETYRWGQSHRSNPWVGNSMKPKPIIDWYRILRAHYRLSRIRSIRFALWLYAGV